MSTNTNNNNPVATQTTFNVVRLIPSKVNTVIPQQKVAGLIGNNKRRAKAVQARVEVQQQHRAEQVRLAKSQFLASVARKLQNRFARLG